MCCWIASTDSDANLQVPNMQQTTICTDTDHVTRCVNALTDHNMHDFLLRKLSNFIIYYFMVISMLQKCIGGNGLEK